MKKSPRWIVWVSDPIEDEQLERHSTVEVIGPNQYDEYEHDLFICDPASESYKAIVNDVNWGNGSDATLREKITNSTQEFRALEKHGLEEVEEFRQWKQNNKESINTTSSSKEVITEVDKLDLGTLQNATAKQIFKLKLDMFEVQAIQEADKDIKKQLRKSDDVFEIISLYHSVVQVASDSEPS